MKFKALLAFFLSLIFSAPTFADVTFSCTAPTVISGGGTLVYWALITGGSSETDPCTSDPCTILRQGPTNWLASVNRVSAGLYQLNYAAGSSAFTNIPAAQISAEGQNLGEIGQLRYSLSNSTHLTVQTVDPGSLTRGDGSFSVMVPAN